MWDLIRVFFRSACRSLGQVLRWTLLVTPIAVVAGSASALFLWLLRSATLFRFSHEWLLFLLPVAGGAMGALYHWIGKPAEGGNNLILEQIHAPGGGVPKRMAPLILVATVLTHLFGGSAGREGTAVQMGGSLASAWMSLYRRWWWLDAAEVRLLLMAGVAAGFGSVFGTPLAGAIFAMEVLVIGRIEYGALIPTLLASLGAHAVCVAWGARHLGYSIAMTDFRGVEGFDLVLLGKVALAGVLFGLLGRLFAGTTHQLQGFLKRWIAWPVARPVAGGLLLMAMVYLLGTRDYLGLGELASHPGAVTISSAFHAGGAQPWSWFWKLLFTAVTLAAGFKGGEVTPLFFMGAALGNTLAAVFGAPVDLFAGLGLIAVFAGAANTPLACTVMGVELFGAHDAVYFAVACFMAYSVSGHAGIYHAQRVGVPKLGAKKRPVQSAAEGKEPEAAIL